jgi:DNA-binding transcriptional regulator YiaG
MSNRSGIEKRQQWDGNNIRALRNHLGLTQRELAEQLGTRQQTISEWEKGLYQPRGTSSTLLTIVAERAQFEYQPHSRDENKKD